MSSSRYSELKELAETVRILKEELIESQENQAKLRELNSELLNVAMRLAALEHKDGGRTFPTPFDCAEARRVVAKSEKLK